MNKPYSIRLPDDLKAMLKDEAKNDGRTISAELRYLIKLGVERRDYIQAASITSQQGRDLAEYIANSGARA